MDTLLLIGKMRTIGEVPIGLIPRLIQHANKRVHLAGHQQSFWPLLFPEGGFLAEFVLKIIQLPCLDWFLIPGLFSGTLFNSASNIGMLAFCLNFKPSCNSHSDVSPPPSCENTGLSK